MGRTTRHIFIALATVGTVPAMLHAQQPHAAGSSDSAHVVTQQHAVGKQENAATGVPDTTSPLLTAEVLQGMTTFWKEFSNEPAATRDPARKGNLKSIEIPAKDVFELFGQLITLDPTARNDPEAIAMKDSIARLKDKAKFVVDSADDMISMAEKFPWVSAAFRKAQLTPQVWERYRIALFAALFLDEIDQRLKLAGSPAVTPPPSATWQNVAFLRAHPQDVAALGALGMWNAQAVKKVVAHFLDSDGSPSDNLQP